MEKMNELNFEVVLVGSASELTLGLGPDGTEVDNLSIRPYCRN